MSCSRCPHYVKHGQIETDTNQITFHHLCALKVKKAQDLDHPFKKSKNRSKPPRIVPKPSLICIHHPFDNYFNHLTCAVYKETFHTKDIQNNAIPTTDASYSESIGRISVTDMDLL